MNLTKLLLTTLSSIIPLSCATRIHTVSNNAKVSVVSYDAARRGAYIRELDGKPVTIVAEPPPDAMKLVSAAIEASAKGIQGTTDATLKGQWATSAVDLARRSQSLQLLREALYRLSEMHANGAVTDQQSAQLYQQVMDTIKIIALTELANSQVPEELKKELFNNVKASGLLGK